MHIQVVGGAQATEVGLGHCHQPNERDDNDREGEVKAFLDP